MSDSASGQGYRVPATCYGGDPDSAPINTGKAGFCMDSHNETTNRMSYNVADSMTANNTMQVLGRGYCAPEHDKNSYGAWVSADNLNNPSPYNSTKTPMIATICSSSKYVNFVSCLVRDAW